MHKLLSIIFCGVLFCSANLIANDESPISRVIEAPSLVGSGQYKEMLWKIYEAELYASEGSFELSNPYALKLVYARKLSGGAITDKSIELIRRQGIEDELTLAGWHEQLSTIFPDVAKGTEIIGVNLQGEEGAYFYVDGELKGVVKDPLLTHLFFGIWLSEDTTAPTLRKKLLGLTGK